MASNPTSSRHAPVEIRHLGAQNCVTGSCHFIRTADGTPFLVDCGIAMGNDTAVPFQNWPVPPKEIPFCFLTHAHLDHIGRIPDLFDAGFNGEIICSRETRALLLPMLEDAMGFSDRTHAQKQALKKKISDSAWGFETATWFDLKNRIQFRMEPAGHILGSVFITFSIPNGSSFYRILFSGDLGRKGTPLIQDPAPPLPCDLMFLESTYGDRNHGDCENRIQTLQSILKRSLADNGKVLIPAFALGRVQELLYELDRVYTDMGGPGNIPVPVFLDSPLAADLTKKFATLSTGWDQTAISLLSHGDHPLDFKGLYTTSSHQEHKKLLHYPGPAIIIAGSGMCTGGRILNHLSRHIEDPRTDVLMVGYQAKGTTGRAIIKAGEKKGSKVQLNGETLSVNASIHVLQGYSAHADQSELLAWVGCLDPIPEIRLVHGDPRAQKSLNQKIHQIKNGKE